MTSGYLGNKHLKKSGEPIEWTPELLNEYIKCANDPIYFAKNYIKIVHVDRGLISFDMFDYQKNIVDKINKNRRVAVLTARQSGKTTTAVAIILHYVLFNSFKTVAILANKGDSARGVLSRIKLAYESLPKWLQHGIEEWNKGNIALENGCKILAGTTTSSAIRGETVAFLYLDEVAFIEGYDEFFASVYPTISSGESTKLLMTSTPKGLNHFWKICKGAEEGTNGYEFVKVMWYEVPGRGEEWKKEALSALNFDENMFNQEYCCVAGNTIVTVIDKETNEIKTISIEDLYDEISRIKTQNKYEILTADGWSNFHGVRKQTATGIVILSLKNGTTLECSLDHRIEVRDGFCEAKDLSVGNEIRTQHGYEEISQYHKDDSKKLFVYDALKVEKGNKYLTNGIVSHNCEFLGSSGTLISGSKLKELSFSIPLYEKDGLYQYEKPKQDHIYAMTVDVGRGKGLDYSTFSVIDITKMPYEQVCVFRDNFISPLDFVSILYRTATSYNNAWILVEVNDIGSQVSDALHIDIGYENLLYTENAGKSGKKLSNGFGKIHDTGIRTSKSVKSVGCSILKMLIEQNQLIIKDYNTIKELSYFSKKGSSYEAESGSHDDLVMNLVLFSWLTSQAFFKEINDINTLTKLREKTEEQINEDLLPFGFIDTGSEFQTPGFQLVNT